MPRVIRSTVTNVMEGAAVVCMGVLIVGGCFFGGRLWERHFNPPPRFIQSCVPNAGLQLSCSPRDQAEYAEVCRIRQRTERIIFTPRPKLGEKAM